jgi:hypothetical protein
MHPPIANQPGGGVYWTQYEPKTAAEIPDREAEATLTEYEVLESIS